MSLWWRDYLAALLLLCSGQLLALEPGSEQFNPLPGSAWALDHQGDWGPEQAWQVYRDGGFASIPGATLNLGPVDFPLWLAFRLEFPQALPPGRWFYSLDSLLFEQAELYWFDGEHWQSLPRAETYSPVAGRLIPSPRPVFALPAEAGAGQNYLLRLAGDEAMLLNARVQTDRMLLASERQRMLWLGLYFGVILALGLYNAMLWLVLRDRSYFWYTLFLASTAGFFILMNQLLLIWWPDLSPRSWSLLVSVAQSTLGIALLLFTRYFMLTPSRDVLIDRLIRYGVWLAPSIPLFNLLSGVHAAVIYSGLLGLYAAAVILWAAWRAARRGFAPAWVVLPTWLLLFGSLAVFVLMYLGRLPYNLWTANGFMIASACEAVLLALALGLRIRSLEQDREQLSQRGKYLLNLSLTDPLTSLFNKRHLANTLQQEVAYAQDHRRSLSLLMLDVDHFKQWNDSWGHLLGDELLRALGEQIRLQLRDSDIPCRYGGEEFCIILPNVGRLQAAQLAERLREAVAGLRIQVQNDMTAGATISVGVAELVEGEDMYALIARADRALYQAKQQGRDRCVLAEASGGSAV